MERSFDRINNKKLSSELKTSLDEFVKFQYEWNFSWIETEDVLVNFDVFNVELDIWSDEFRRMISLPSHYEKLIPNNFPNSRNLATF